MCSDEKALSDLTLAPYIIKATALIGKRRRVGGNQFRHAVATLAVLLDYKYFSNHVLLKASVIHDLIEDVPETNVDELRYIDKDAPKVVDLVLEVTKGKDEKKIDYLQRVLEKGSNDAKILKVADRISNVTDMNLDIYSRYAYAKYIIETEKYVIPMAEEVSENMWTELKDLVEKRRMLF